MTTKHIKRRLNEIRRYCIHAATEMNDRPDVSLGAVVIFVETLEHLYDEIEEVLDEDRLLQKQHVYTMQSGISTLIAFCNSFIAETPWD